MITPLFSNMFAKTLSFGKSQVNMVYCNDMHGSLSYIDNFVTGRDEFYRKNKDGSNWTVAGGDMFIKGSPNNKIVANFIDKYVDVSSVGNHDISNARNFSELLKKYNLSDKFLSANLRVDKGAPLEGQIAKSAIYDDGKEVLGFIGLSPMDFDRFVSRDRDNSFVSVKDLRETVNAVRCEVEKLEAQGVDKIILLAHTGETSIDGRGIDYYKTFAKIGGIDVIVGGHDHVLVDRWEHSRRRKIDKPNEFEPVKIVATGSDDDYYFSGNLNLFGTMNLTFDDNGVLIPNECKNEIKYSHDYPKTDFISHFIDEDEKKVIGVLDAPIVTTSNPLRNENKVANFVADSDFWYATKHCTDGEKPDFAFVNAGTIRDSFPDVEVTKNRIQQVLPFKESLVKARLTKAEIYEALTIAARSTLLKKATPGMMQVSHMNYQINPDYSVSNVKILDDFSNVRFNLDDMDEDEEFVCVYDSFLSSGPGLLTCLQADYAEDLGVTRAQALSEFLKSGEIPEDYVSDRITFKK